LLEKSCFSVWEIGWYFIFFLMILFKFFFFSPWKFYFAKQEWRGFNSWRLLLGLEADSLLSSTPG
jgi:hypothetical protein